MKLDDIIEPLEQDPSCIGKYEYKILAYSSVNRNGQIISKDALKGQDGKRVPLKFGTTPAQVIHSIIVSYDYNRNDAHLLRVIKNVISRLEDKVLDKEDL